MSTPAFRVWLGWRADRLRSPGRWKDFVDHLKRTFVPATWQVMCRFGLLAYAPSVLQEVQNDELPDETALLVYRGVDEYKTSFGTVIGRAYSLLHGAVFESLAPHTSRSAWASPWPDAPEPKLAAYWWPAASDGPVFTDVASNVVYLVLRHPAEAPPDAGAVYGALGKLDGEVVICQVPKLSFIWLATRVEHSAQVCMNNILAAWPDWKQEAAHDATFAACEGEPFDSVKHEIALDAGQTLHFAVHPPGAN